ncbi:ParB family chromosome partitioning protein [Sagittula marina]|uniref:ParB family chromosome partitioning protein n=1 Tax=Sagittula marina TaxID=943940 RepID=A0A7W6DS86_9RHOB|nr:plasmid partitioning protein RepB [Sagittula marina]MBB3988251.1 ParB family chromosome partitioning protein [Sagittula marina]
MTDKKKSRLSMLDSLAGAGMGPAAAPQPMMSSNRALRSARNAVDGHNVWELDPDSIDDLRLNDRMDLGDLSDLRRSIEENGQAVPILVRRLPGQSERYGLVYGRRRLAAIAESDQITKVRALVATLDEDDALRAQVAENSERRDLSYIEKAMFAHQLARTGFGTQDKVAEVLNVTKSWISMANAVLRGVGTELAGCIGPAPGIGRPRWEALARGIAEHVRTPEDLLHVARQARVTAMDARSNAPEGDAQQDISVSVFEAVEKAVHRAAKRPAPASPPPQTLTLDGSPAGRLRRTSKGLAVDLTDGGFADWLRDGADEIFEELHARYRAQR